jgi:hypothetical protein
MFRNMKALPAASTERAARVGKTLIGSDGLGRPAGQATDIAIKPEQGSRKRHRR